MFLISQSNFLQAVGWAILNSFWQIALLWIIFRAIVYSYPAMKADLKTTLATGLLFTGFTWFLYTIFSLLFFTQPLNPVSNLAGKMAGSDTWVSWSGNILQFTSLVYFILLAIPVWRFATNYRYVQYIRNRGLQKADPEWKIFVARMAARMGIQKPVGIWLSELVNSPVTVGFLKPIILIPVAAVNQLSTKQVEAIILHELSHIRRFDYLFNLVINFIQSVLYFNPFVRLFVKTIEKERENRCDDLVIQFQYQPYDYAAALLQLEKDNTGRYEMMIPASGRKNDFVQRIENILGMKQKELFSFRRFTGTLAVFLGALILNAFLLISKKPDGKIFLGMSQGNNPYYFLLSSKQQPLEEIKTMPVEAVSVAPDFIKADPVYEIKAVENGEEPEDWSFDTKPAGPNEPVFYHVNYTTPVVQELDPDEEIRLKKTVEATRKVMQESQWKEIENSYAELLNKEEKARLKFDFQYELQKVDWEKLETQLRLSYNSIDWDRVNDELASSLIQIRLDSIQVAVSHTLNELGQLEKWMKENKTTCIPDSDITLQSVKAGQQEYRKHLEKVRSIRQKKVVRL